MTMDETVVTTPYVKNTFISVHLKYVMADPNLPSLQRILLLAVLVLVLMPFWRLACDGECSQNVVCGYLPLWVLRRKLYLFSPPETSDSTFRISAWASVCTWLLLSPNIYLHIMPWLLCAAVTYRRSLACFCSLRQSYCPLNLELAWIHAKVNAVWGSCFGALSWQNCGDWERFLLTAASLMAVWHLSWITHVWLGNMQHIWEPPILERSVLWSAQSDVAYTHLEASSCHQTWALQPSLHV